MLNLLNSRVDGILEKIKERRGDKAFEFASTAEYCMGQEALEHGLVDQVIESPELYIQERFGATTQIMFQKQDWKAKLFGTELVESFESLAYEECEEELEDSIFAALTAPH